MGDLDDLDFDAAEKAVEEAKKTEQEQPAPAADNDCGDSCTI